MGRRILSTGITLDVSSQSSAPVAPAGAMRMRPKADGSTIQLSYNTGAYFDLAGGGGGAPGGSSTELQYRAGASTFGAVTGSSVDGAGKVTVLDLVTDQLAINGGSSLGVYYRDTFGHVVTTAGAGSSGQYLKSSVVGNLPIFGALNMSDASAGTLALARGGTGASLTDPGADRIMFWDDSAGAIDWLTAGTGLTITGTTITSSGGATPGGSGSELQYRSGASTFGAVNGSSVDGAGLVTVLNLVTDELTINGGSSRGVYYRDTSGNVVTTAGGTAGEYLKVSAVGNLPILGPLNMSDAAAGTLAIGRGGTGLASTPTNGQVLIGNGTNYTLSTLTAGSNVSITNGSGSITIAATAGGTPAGSGTELQYRAGASTFGALASSSVSGSDLTIGAGLFLNLTTALGVLYADSAKQVVSTGAGTQGQYLRVALGGIPQLANLNMSDAASGTLAVGRGGTGLTTTPSNGQVLIGNGTNYTLATLTAGTNVSITNGAGSITINSSASGGSPGGSGSELQYRSSSTTFGAVSGSSVSGSVITLGTSTDFTTLQGAAITLQADNGTALSTRVHHATLAPTFASYRSRGTNASKTAVQSGDTLFSSSHSGYYDSSSLRIGGQTYFTSRSNWTSTEATAIFGVSTNHGTNVAPIERLVLGGFKTLTDAAVTDIFTITYGTSDHLAAGGEIHLLLVAKQVSGGNQIQSWRRKMNFATYHNGATNTGAFHITEDSGARAALDSGPSWSVLAHSVSDYASRVNLDTAITSSGFNAVTWKLAVDTAITTVSQLSLFFHIVYTGEIQVTLA